jgi:5-methylcytosine-specific restriction endonuclease McrA
LVRGHWKSKAKKGPPGGLAGPICRAPRSQILRLFAFRSQPITAIKKQVSRKLWPIREISLDDLGDEKNVVLKERLQKSEFGAPILENYLGGRTFFGMYHASRRSASQVDLQFRDRAVSFFEDIVRALPGAKDNIGDELYPQIENRKRVAAHLRRERSRLLATQRKRIDDYTRQVCGFRFDAMYGRLGNGFAEAHHRVPLQQLRGEVETRIEDLVTVCANCHRMLHQMSGQETDVSKLKKIVRRKQQ